MAAEQRKLLEQLMGASATSPASKVSFSDPKLCRSYIAGTCPHILFTNTKQDLGPCPKIHSEALKAEYDAMSEREKSKLGFEYDYIRHLYKYIDECNRVIDSAQRRLKKTPEEIRQTNVLVSTMLFHAGPFQPWATIANPTRIVEKHFRLQLLDPQWPPRSRNTRLNVRSVSRAR